MKKLLCVLSLCLFATANQAVAQDLTLTREQVLNMSMEDLSNLSLEELMYSVELLDVQNVDELFSLIMNKDVSSASKKTENSFKSPLSTSVITREEMRTYGCTSIEEALRLIPGVISREKTNGNYDIHLRGLDNVPNGNIFLYTENTNTLVMVDGRPVFNYATGAMMWETLPVGIEEIERIEVVRGACGALYGSNAVTGVINIITAKPNTDSPLVAGSMQSGSQNTYIGDIALRKAFGAKLAMSLSGNFQMRDRTTSDVFLMPYEDANYVDERGEITDFSNGVYISAVDMQYIHMTNTSYYSDDTYYTGNVSEDTAPVEDRFANSDLARKSLGFNYILNFTPSADVNVRLMTGYQTSQVMTSPVRNDLFSLNMRESKQFYADVAADVKGVSLQLNWTRGPQDFAKGAPSYKVMTKQFTANLDYDWSIGETLSIRPGINYRWNQMSDKDYSHMTYTNYLGNTAEMSSYFNGSPSITAIAPSVRADWSPIEPLRIIAAYRAEKMSCPDKWYHSYQAAFTYSINNNNNLRLIASRANRSSILINTDSDYTWDRTGMCSPSVLYVAGNKDAKVMSADNFEIGYRVRPTKRILVDLEAYYNFSRDYGEIMTTTSEAVMTKAFLDGVMSDLIDAYNSGSFSNISITDIVSESVSLMKYRSSIQYQNLPFKVRSMGVSLSADWIISQQLVAKINANVQRTIINDYYFYDQNGDLAAQCKGAYTALGSCMAHLYSTLYNAHLTGQTFSEDAVNEIYDTYNFVYDADDDVYSVGQSGDNTGRDLEQGYVNKSTPTFYGSVGLIYKPFEKLSVAANAYFYTKQESTILIGSETIKGKCTLNLKVGYKPIDQFEVFFNAHNLLNDTKREFIYADYNRGIYSMGVNFTF